MCITITLQIHSTRTCTFSSTSPYSTSITPHAQQHFQVKARDQKQKTAFQIFHFICKGKRRKIEMIIFFFLPIRLTYVCLCFSILPHIYMKSLCLFFGGFFPLGLSQAFTHARPLQETCPQHTILIFTIANQFLHLSQAASSTSRLSPRGADSSTLNNPQIILNLLSELRNAQKHVPPSCSRATASFPPGEGAVSHSRRRSALLASSQGCGFQR